MARPRSTRRRRRTIHGSAAPSLPVASAVGWWDASQIAGATDGGQLSTWPDMSGNGKTLTASDATNTIYRTTAGVNNTPCVDLTSVSTQFSSSLNLTQPFTVYIVVKIDDIGDNDMLLGNNGSNNFYIMLATAKWRLSNGANFDTNISKNTTDTQRHTIICNGASSIVDVADTEATGDGSTGAWDSFRVGRAAGGGFDGKISEIAAFASAHSAGDQALMEAYFTAKYGVA